MNRLLQTDRKRYREILFLAVGVSTPLGILAVNGSAFVMLHLTEFRVGIAVCALISGLSLNVLGAYTALSRANTSLPRLYAEYRVWVIGIAVLIVVVWSVLGAWGTFVSMRDPTKLPNLFAVLTAIWLLILPFGMNALSKRLRVGGRLENDPGLRQAQPPPIPDA
jgi:fluoride ion exporter CrcB/FEX